MGEVRRIGETKQLLAEEVFRHLGMAIVTGELKPLQRIKDAEIALELHVSRMPIREALQRLERIGLVTMYPSRYTEVTEVTPHVVAESVEFAAFQAGFVARLATERMTVKERDEVAALVDDVIAVVDDAMASSLARKELFGRLSELSNNALQHNLLMEASMALARNLEGLRPPDDAEHMVAQLSALKEALLTADGAASERISREIHGYGSTPPTP